MLIVFVVALLGIIYVAIADLPECRWPSRSMWIPIFIKPGTNDAALGPEAADLYAVTAPSLFSAVARQ
jgi:hypothetical protein